MDLYFDKELYMDQCSLFFNFLLRKKQWSGINQADYIRWMNNFDDIEDGQYIGQRILNFLLYYSEDDLLKMLDDTIMSIFEKEIVLPLQLSKVFSALPSEIEYAVSEAMQSTVVIPIIEDFADPGASGPEVTRYVRNHFNPQLQLTFSDRLLPDAKYDKLIIVDDCIGSGEQFSTFWKEAQISNGSLLRTWVKTHNVSAFLIALVGYKETVERLQDDFSDISIICAEYISSQHEVFSPMSTCWKDSTERLWAEEVLQNHMIEYEIPLKGYKELGFAVALHKTIPDWSIPILYKNKNGWKHFIERKTTYV